MVVLLGNHALGLDLTGERSVSTPVKSIIFWVLASWNIVSNSLHRRCTTVWSGFLNRWRSTLSQDATTNKLSLDWKEAPL